MGIPEDCKTIVDDAVKYGFYPDEIKLYNDLYHHNPILFTSAFKFDVRNWGWAIVLEKDDFVEVRFIFVYPECRRQGNFKMLINSLKEKMKRIIVCSKEPTMIRSLISLGFKLDGKSINGKELRYIII